MSAKDATMSAKDATMSAKDATRSGKDATRSSKVRDHERQGRDYEREGRDHERQGRDPERRGCSPMSQGRDHERQGRGHGKPKPGPPKSTKRRLANFAGPMRTVLASNCERRSTSQARSRPLSVTWTRKTTACINGSFNLASTLKYYILALKYFLKRM